MYFPKNRFDLLDQIILHLETLGVNYLAVELDQLDQESIFQTWDAVKIVLVEQKILTENSKFVKANTRNGRRLQGGPAISRETVYIGEILEQCAKLKRFDHLTFAQEYQNKIKYSNKKSQDFRTVGIQFEKEDLDSASHWIDEDSKDDGDCDNAELTSRVEAILKVKLKPIEDRLKLLEDNYTNIQNSFTLNKTKLVNDFDQKLAKLDLSQILGQQQAVEKQLKELKTLKNDFDKSFADVARAPPPAAPLPRQSQPQRFQVWGRSADTSGVPTIPRVFHFAVSKIPNKEEYSADWLKKEQVKNFKKQDLKATIIECEQIKPSFPNARTKTFRVLIMTEDRKLTVERFADPYLWVNAVSISRYRRPRYQLQQQTAEAGQLSGPKPQV